MGPAWPLRLLAVAVAAAELYDGTDFRANETGWRPAPFAFILGAGSTATRSLGHMFADAAPWARRCRPRCQLISRASTTTSKG